MRTRPRLFFKLLYSGTHDIRDGPSPACMNGSTRAADRIGKQDRNAVGHNDRDRNVRAGGQHAVCFLQRKPRRIYAFINVRYLGAMNLLGEEQRRRATRPQHAMAVLVHGRRIIAPFEPDIHRVVGRYADAAGTLGEPV